MEKGYIAANKDVMNFSPIELGFTLINPAKTGGKYIVVRPYKISLESEPTKQLIKFYNSKKWQKSTIGLDYTQNNQFKKYYDNIGIKFVPDLKTKRWKLDEEDSTTVELLCTWMYQVDFSNGGEVSVSPFDRLYPLSFFGKNQIDEYAKDISDMLLEKGLIKEVDIDA